MSTSKRMMVGGDLYVYRDEDKNAVAIAMSDTGPRGGWVGRDIAKMAIPRPAVPQEQINKFADLFAAAPDLLEALRELNGALNDGLCNSGTPGFDSGRLGRAQDAAVAAIARAEGQS